MEIPNLYELKNYKFLILIPTAMIILSLYFILVVKIPTGLDLRGGTLLTITTNSSFDQNALQNALKTQLGVHDVSVSSVTNPTGTTVQIEIEQNPSIASGENDMLDFYSQEDTVNTLQYDISRYISDIQGGNLTASQKADENASLVADQASLPQATQKMYSIADSVIADYEPFVGKIDRSNFSDTTSLEGLLSNASTNAKEAYKNKIISIIGSQMQIKQFSLEDVSPSLSQFFVSQTINVLIWSFILTSIVVVLIFRSFVPSLAVFLGAASDIVIALGGMGLFQIPLDIPSIAALLMLIGYSMDTDLLLTIRVMKRTEGTPEQRAYEAMKTGLMMTVAAFIGFFVLFLLANFTQISTYYEISAVAIFGLVGDVFATWCTNAVIILWEVERKAKGVRK